MLTFSVNREKKTKVNIRGVSDGQLPLTDYFSVKLQWQVYAIFLQVGKMQTPA